ncbi:MAG: ABC transporter permease [Thermoanaerobaculia bacterium]
MLESTVRLLSFRGLVSTLVARELKARYRGSVLGFFWSLVTPLVLLAVYTFVFSTIFKPRFEGADPYVLFLMTGLFPWTWIAGSLQEGAVSLTANSGLIRKAVFPAEVLPMVAVLSNLVHFLLALPILAAGLVVGRLAGFPVSGWGALLFPGVVLLLLLTLGGMTLALAALNVHFKDVKDIVANLLALLFYLTPVIYPLNELSRFPLLSGLVRWGNPFTPFVVSLQTSLFTGTVPPLNAWLHMVAWAALWWLIGGWLFQRLSENLAEAV